jgi:hypothetical protein
MSDIQRYSFAPSGMGKSVAGGTWVRYEDHEAEVERLTALLADANKRAEKNFVTNLNTELMDLSGRQVNRIADLENALRFSLGQNDDPRARIPDPDDLRALSEIVRMPNAEHVADRHNLAVRRLRATLPKEEPRG